MGKVKWTDENLEEEAKKYSTRKEFEIKNQGAHSTARKRGVKFFDAICAHMILCRKAPVVWTDEKLRDEAKKYRHRVEFKENCFPAYERARKRGKDFMDTICSHMKPSGFRWELSEVIKEAKKFKTKMDFKIGCNGAYKWAVLNNKLDVTCKHMEKNFWNIEEITSIAKKFETRSEFISKNCSAYRAALRNGWLTAVCSHMKSGKGAFKINEGGFLYQFRVVRGRKVYYKVGISNHDTLIRATQFGIKDGVYIERTHAIWFEDGAECRQMEKELHAAAKANGLQYIGKDLMKNGYTEIFTKPLLQ